MAKKANILDNIVNWLKGFFNKQKMLEETFVDNELQVQKEPNPQSNQTEKDKFIELYNNVKKHRIDIKELEYEDVERIKKMLFEEIKIKNQKLNELQIENNELEKELIAKKIEEEELRLSVSSLQGNS